MNDFDEFDAEFNMLKNIDRLEDARMMSLEKVIARSGKKNFNMLPVIISYLAVVVVGLFLMMTIKEHTPLVESGKTITDHLTSPEIPFVEITPKMFTVEYKIDNMDRGNHDYETIGTEKVIVVDTKMSDYQRGDVIYFSTPKFSNESLSINLAKHHISRVVGLPGEKIEIKEGQVYIDDLKLEAFYSFPTVRGMNKDEYLATIDRRYSNMTEEDFRESMESIVVSENSLFVLGDQWWRSIDSRHFGPLPLSKVEGIVVGYVTEQ